MSNLLIQEVPLMVLPTLATKIGINEAMFLQQLHYWVDRSKHEMDGRKWIYNTVDDWCKQFPFWSRRTLVRVISNLEKQNLIMSANYNHKGFDRTKWYTVNYDRLDELEKDDTPPFAPLGNNNDDDGGDNNNGGNGGNKNNGNAKNDDNTPVKSVVEKRSEAPPSSKATNCPTPRMSRRDVVAPYAKPMPQNVGGTSIVSNWHNEINSGLAASSQMNVAGTSIVPKRHNEENKGSTATAQANVVGTSIMSNWHNEQRRVSASDMTPIGDIIGKMIVPTCHTPLCQNGTMHYVNLAQPIPENNNKRNNNTENNNNNTQNIESKTTTSSSQVDNFSKSGTSAQGNIELLLLSAPKYGLRENTVRKFIKEFGEELVLKEFALLKKLIDGNKPIQNPAGWFRRALEEQYTDTRADYEQIQREKKAVVAAKNKAMQEFYERQAAEERKVHTIDPSSPFYRYLERHNKNSIRAGA